MKNILSILLIFVGVQLQAQPTIYPAKAITEKMYIIHGNVHVGNGIVLKNTDIEIENGKIVAVKQHITEETTNKMIIDATNKEVYPGLILPSTDVGLREIASGVRGSNDYDEIGLNNASIHSITAYNTDSKIINVLRDNGILIAHIIPEGDEITGQSSVVQFDAWNWEDAVYQKDNGIHIHLPSYLPKPLNSRSFFSPNESPQNMQEIIKTNEIKIQRLKNFFKDAKSYLQESNHDQINLKFEAVKELFLKKKTLFIHADDVKQMLKGIDFLTEFDFKIVIVGGLESYQIASILSNYKIPVILNPMHELPSTEDDDIDQPFKTPAILQKAGVLFAINDNHNQTRYRNLAFNAGTAATFGLSKEEALAAITFNAAKILGIDNKTGTIEVGKDANILVSDGDILDMKTNHIVEAFIQGRKINLDNIQKQLYERYRKKYEN